MAVPASVRPGGVQYFDVAVVGAGHRARRLKGCLAASSTGDAIGNFRIAQQLQLRRGTILKFCGLRLAIGTRRYGRRHWLFDLQAVISGDARVRALLRFKFVRPRRKRSCRGRTNRPRQPATGDETTPIAPADTATAKPNTDTPRPNRYPRHPYPRHNGKLRVSRYGTVIDKALTCAQSIETEVPVAVSGVAAG